jgi:sulfite exporter TauE/SafE
MCASRMQRILTAIMLGLILYYFGASAQDFQAGMRESQNFKIAFVLQFFVIVMMIIWAVTNFCPSTWMMNKIFPPCDWEK